MSYITILLSAILMLSCSVETSDFIEINKEHKELFDSGRIKAFGTTLNGKKIGEWKFRWDNDTIEEYAVIGNYLNDVQQGKWIYFSMFQDTSIIGFYHNGLMHGDWRFIAGSTYSIYPYNRGKMTGAIIKYQDGEIFETGEVVNWKKIHGTWYKTDHFGDYVYDKWYTDSIKHPTQFIPKIPDMDSTFSMLNFTGK